MIDGLISKNRAKEAIRSVVACWRISPCLSQKEAELKADALLFAVNIIDDQPTVQPQGNDKDRLIDEINRVYREEVLSEAPYRETYEVNEVFEIIDGIIEIINEQPQTGWIPCSSENRLTEQDCSGIVGFKGLMRYYNFNDFQKMARKLLYYEDLAEQGRLAYLPQPYKESE